MPQGTLLSDDDLRLIARAGIADGRLPLIASQSMQASYGSGIKCHLCERPIEQQHIPDANRSSSVALLCLSYSSLGSTAIFL